ncbi:hypothetical protein EWM64_g328 [Hericium alpestre]|uniref:Uncharacterized protein n=1 Tax=Hericium alpestre TaxID=135208 RepID=A0A4Z0ABF9_9AGAM|nr:hypothetical protein EWM64_g328 [Hericium alpestre]
MIIDPFEPRAFDMLPSELLVYPKKPHNNRKHYHFGVGVSYERLWEYCIARDLAPKHFHENPLCSSAMVDAALKELDRLCGAKLQLCGITHLEHDYVLSRYSNYTWFKEKLSDRDEEEVVNIIHKELGISEPPRWYHKLVKSPSGYGLF